MKKLSYLIIFLVLIIDQASKFWIKLNMELRDNFKIFEWFQIYFIENNGMAYGLEFGGIYGKIFLTVFRLFAVIILFKWLFGCIKQGKSKIYISSIALIIAGAIGNILDSLFYGVIFNHSDGQLATLFPEEGGYSNFFLGKVVDMFYFPLWEGYLPEWIPIMGGDYFIFFQPIFNVADSAISIGAVLLLGLHSKFFKKYS